MKTLVTICVAAVMLLVLSSVVLAVPSGTVDISNNTNGLSSQADFSLAGYYSARIYTGIYSFTASNGTGNGVLVPNWGFCIDVVDMGINATYIVDTSIENYPLPSYAMGTEREALIRQLWARSFNPDWITNPTSDNINRAGAFNCAQFEIIFENSLTQDSKLDLKLGTGNLQTRNLQGGYDGLAQSMLDALTDGGPESNEIAIISNINGGQDYIVRIPEPATICMLGLGALSLIRRRRVS